MLRRLGPVPSVDAALGAVLAVAAVVTTANDPHALHPLADVCAGLVGASVALRTRGPAVMAVVTAVAIQAMPGVSGVLWLLATILVVGFSVPLRLPRRTALACLAPLSVSGVVLQSRSDTMPEAAVTPLVLIGGSAGAGALVAASRRRGARIRALADQIAAEHDLHRRLAAEAERARVARDLHDILGHSLTVVAVQATAAASLLDAGMRAAAPVGAVADQTREALVQVRSIVALTRGGPAAPAPTAVPPAAVTRRLPPAVTATAVLVATIGCLVFARLTPDPGAFVAFVVVLPATFLAAAALRGAWRASALGVALVCGFLMPEDQTSLAGRIVAPLLLIGAPALAGVLLARSVDLGRRLRLLAADLDRQRATSARLATESERARIAHELEDVLAHTLSGVAVQAAAAREVLPRAHPAAAPLDAVVAEARRALEEVRSLLVGESADPAPAPSLDRVADLVAAGDAELVLRGAPRPLPAGLSLAAFRVLQEALTNVRKHAPGSRPVVIVDYAADALRLSVQDDGLGRERGAGGRGLIGMSARVHAHAGTLDAGPLPGDRGWRVAAELPYGSAP